MHKAMCRAAVVLIYAAWLTGAHAATRYVDGNLSSNCTSGNYSVSKRNCSGSDGSAWISIRDGLQNTTGAGDTLFIRGGTYTNQQIDLSFVANGTSWTNLTRVASYENELVIVSYDTTRSGVANAGLGARYIVLEGSDAAKLVLDGQNGTTQGIAVAGVNSCDFIRFRNLEIRNNRGG